MFRRATRALLVLALVVGISACTDGDDGRDDATGDPLTQIRDATFDGGTARYTGEVRFADGSSGPVRGESQAEPPAGDVRFPLATDGGVQEVQVVWVDGSVYVRRAITPDPDQVSAVLRRADDLPWTASRYQPLATTVFAPYDPFRLLELLVRVGAPTTADGTETVDGEGLARYEVDLRPFGTVAPGGAQTAELLADDDHRLRVVRLAGDQQVEYAIESYGDEVAPSAPPAGEIGTSASLPAVDPTGPFEPVAQGVDEGVSWTLLRAPGEDGGSCWRLDTDAPLDPVAATHPDGVTCIAEIGPDDDDVEVVVDAGAGAAVEVVVVVAAPGSTIAGLQLEDGSRREVVADPSGFAVYVGPRQPIAAVLEVVTPSGLLVTCGPGPVTELDDITFMAPDDAARLDRTPWLCIAL